MKETRKNKASLYINEKMEYQVVNLEKEYGEGLDGCRYAVASYHDKKTLEEMYSEELRGFSPYIYLTVSEFQAINEYQKNETKYLNRYSRKHDAFEYSEEMTPKFHNSLDIDSEILQDPLNIIIEAQDENEWEVMLKRIPKALEALNEPYKSRIYKYFYKKETILEIAKEEGISKQAVWNSLLYAEKKMKKIIKNQK